MEPTEVLAELMSLSSQIEDVAILGGSGFVLGSSGTPERGEQLARVAAELLAAAADVRPAGEVSRIEVRRATGSVFVVSEGGRSVVATTVPEPTAGPRRLRPPHGAAPPRRGEACEGAPQEGRGRCVGSSSSR